MKPITIRILTPEKKVHSSEDQKEFECAFCEFEKREQHIEIINSLNGYDLREACPYFDDRVVGCYGCSHMSEARAILGLDYRLTCHLEQEFLGLRSGKKNTRKTYMESVSINREGFN